ncbi:unnamed protein product [Orchesella dallaii]|uniref:Odorant receptor n=1 Tax=Orchesella dallaii TaxID=48710 RepID=A0ABP1RJ47_9HEXA
MLTHDCFLPHLVQLSKPGSHLTSLGFYWDPVKGLMVEFPRDSILRRLHKVTSYAHHFSVILTLLQTAIAREKDLSKMMISSFGLIIICFCTICVRVYDRNLKKCVMLINELVKTAKEFREPGTRVLDTKEKFIKFLAPIFHWSAMAVPFAFVGGVVWSVPCMSSNFGYFLLKECSPTLKKSYECLGEVGGVTPVLNSMDYLTKFLFLATNLWIWSYSVQCAVFIVIGVVMLGAMSIRSFLKYYERQMLLSTPNSCGSTSKNQKTLLKNALIYRRLQLLTSRFNYIHQLQILVPLLFTVTSHQVFSVYGTIKFKGQLNFVSYALFVILGSQGFLVIMGMFTALADVFSMSNQVKKKLEKKHRCHKWLRRFHAACPIIKIRFGRLNFIDTITPLVFENFAFVQTTNILMVE